MTRVLLASNNKRVIESITETFNSSINSEFCLLSISRYDSIWGDILDFGANIVVVDMTDTSLTETRQLYEMLCCKQGIKCIVLIDGNKKMEEMLTKDFICMVDGYIEYRKTETFFDKLVNYV